MNSAQPITIEYKPAPGIPQNPLDIIGWIIGWAIWAYAWMVAAAITIFFVESGFDIYGTLEESVFLVFWPIVEIVMMLYVHCVYPIFCLFDSCFWHIFHPFGGPSSGGSSASWFDYLQCFLVQNQKACSKITTHGGGTKVGYKPPEYCGGKNSQACKNAPVDPNRWSMDHFFCGSQRSGSMCQFSDCL